MVCFLEISLKHSVAEFQPNGLRCHLYKIEKMRFGSGVTDTADTKDHGVVTGYFAAAADA